jgi:hypothetical protein
MGKNTDKTRSCVLHNVAHCVSSRKCPKSFPVNQQCSNRDAILVIDGGLNTVCFDGLGLNVSDIEYVVRVHVEVCGHAIRQGAITR